MRLGIIGGASVRTPLLVKNLLSRKDSGLESLALFDTDYTRLKLMSSLMETISQRLESTVKIELCATFEQMAQGADFVFSSYRQGGDAGRVLDEKIPGEFGMLGQETVGAGGAAMALRTIPSALEYANKLKDIAPGAWMINFTNPSGILSQALLNYSKNENILGICDAPVVVKNMAARYLRCPVDEISFKSFGLNHLGWVYDIRLRGEPVLERLVAEAEAFCQEEPLYTRLTDHIKETGLIPNEYLLFYLHSREIQKNYTAGSYSRSGYIRQINDEFFQKLRDRRGEGMELYQEYLARREGSYMSVETGKKREEEKHDFFTTRNHFGYDDVAIAVMDALRGRGDLDLPVNRRNDSCPYLEAGDVVEVTSVIREGRVEEGFEVPDLPASLVDLLIRVKTYERKLVDGFMRGSKSLVLEGMKANPLIRPDKAEALLDRIISVHSIGGLQ